MTLPLAQIPAPVATDAAEDYTNPPMRNFNMKKLIKKNDGSFEFEKKTDFIFYTPGPWRRGNVADVIIADIPAPKQDQEVTAYYGGFVICESVSEENIPLIIAAPELLKACCKLLAARDGTDADRIREAYEFAQQTIAKATKVES